MKPTPEQAQSFWVAQCFQRRDKRKNYPTLQPSRKLCHLERSMTSTQWTPCAVEKLALSGAEGIPTHSRHPAPQSISITASIEQKNKAASASETGGPFKPPFGLSGALPEA